MPVRPMCSRGVDAVLMGAGHASSKDGSVIKKPGSSLIAMAAAARGVKVYFVARDQEDMP
jgi:translation initiation factor 2B subunit (eIF-2B alpha/beta/delta family)